MNTVEKCQRMIEIAAWHYEHGGSFPPIEVVPLAYQDIKKIGVKPEEEQ